MSLQDGLRRLARRVLRRPAAADAGPRRRFGADEIDAVCDTYFNGGSAAGGPWDAWRDAHLQLPDWFRHGMDPYGHDYAQQQHRLWQLVAGVERRYEARIDEKEHDWSSADPVRTPGFYARRDAGAVASASDHVLAIGMLLKHCGLRPGDWALEYGAGFGQAALALARLGVNVDTVDISDTFCGFVREQAASFQVPLTPFVGEFGVNPRPGQRYQLIWFYESFHHCVDFVRVAMLLREHLAPGGRLILAGEPIVEHEYDAVPYPWGVRLHSEVVAVVRKQHWFELGFSEDFLFDLFTKAGFVGRRVDCEPSMFGRLYIFEALPPEIHPGRIWLPPRLARGWSAAESDGRWSTSCSTLPLPDGDAAAIEVELSNPHRYALRLDASCGGQTHRLALAPRQRASVRFDAPRAGAALTFRCEVGFVQACARLAGRRPGVLVQRVRRIAAPTATPTQSEAS